MTALMRASQSGNKDIVEILLQHGANIDLKNEVSGVFVLFCFYYLFLH